MNGLAFRRLLFAIFRPGLSPVFAPCKTETGRKNDVATTPRQKKETPALNRLDWQRAQQFHELVDYYRGLIGLRRYFPRLSALDTASPAAIQFFSLEQPLVGWLLPAQWGDGAAWQALCVFYNPTDTSRVVPLPAGQWKLLSDGTSSSLWRGESRTYEREAEARPPAGGELEAAQ